MTIGMFVMGSTINPLMLISICINVPPTRPPRRSPRCPPPPRPPRPTRCADRPGPPNPRWRPRQVHDHVATRPPRELGLAAPAGRVHQHVDLPPHQVAI